MSAELEFTNKIRYAEEWLNKAKKEFSDGSTTTAASHLILAIAEMETLKRSLFNDEPVILSNQPVRRVRRIDIRPFIAAALFLIALGIFSFSSNKESSNTYMQPVMSDSHFNSLIGSLDSKASALTPELQNLAIPEIINNQLQGIVADPNTNVPQKSTASYSKHSRKSKSSFTKIDSHKMTPPVEAPSYGITNITPGSWSIDPAKSDLNPKMISLETIIAAKESLNEK
jgi:hypothetical protein